MIGSMAGALAGFGLQQEAALRKQSYNNYMAAQYESLRAHQAANTIFDTRILQPTNSIVFTATNKEKGDIYEFIKKILRGAQKHYLHARVYFLS